MTCGTRALRNAGRDCASFSLRWIPSPACSMVNMMSGSLSSDTPAPVRLRVGDGVVDLATREIRMAEARSARRVTPKAIGVLRALARAPGEVVGRNELLAEVWPDTLPTDDVLTQAVTQLRKAFGAGATGAEAGKAYIETIAKGGYRLTVPVEVLVSEGRPAPAVTTTDPAFLAVSAQTLPSSPLPGATRLRRWWLAVAAVALVAIAVLGLWTAYEAGRLPAETVADSPGPSPVSRPYRLITSSAGFELSPSLSPDASTVAFASSGTGDATRQSAIFVQTTSSAVPRQLSRPPEGARDDLPAWSPDGREIAFARWEAGGACRVLLVASTGVGEEREIARCDNSDLLSFEWLPDGSGLLFGTMTGADVSTRLRILDPVGGRWRNLDYPGARGDIDYAPQVSPDGRWIGFIRNPQMGDLWRVPIEGGTPEQITRLGAEMRGWSWAPDGASMVFGLRVDSESRLYRADLADGTVSDLGIDDAQSPTVSARTGMLAFVHRRPQFGLFRIDGGSGEWQRLFPSSGRDTQPTVSPDGSQIVFTSDRAGRFELWWARLDAPASLRPIEGVRPDTRQSPTWSADGRRLLVTALDVDNAPVILEIEPATGRIEPLEVRGSHPAQALYGPEDSILVLEADREGGSALSLVAYDRVRGPVGPRIEGVSLVRFDAVGGRLLFTRLDANGLWSVAPSLAHDTVVRLSERLPTRWRYRSWALAQEGGVAYLDASPGCWAQVSRFRATSQALEPAGIDCVDPVTRSTTNGFSVHGSDLFVSLASEDGSDIGFMRLPQPDAARDGIAKWLISLRRKAS